MDEELYASIRSMGDRDKVSRFFDDGCVVVGWEDIKESIVTVGSNTKFNRDLADLIVDSIKSL